MADLFDELEAQRRTAPPRSPDLFDELAARQPAPAGGDLFDELESGPQPEPPVRPATLNLPPVTVTPREDFVPIPEPQQFNPEPQRSAPLFSTQRGTLNMLGALATTPETVRRGLENPITQPLADALSPVTQGFDVGGVRVPGTQDSAGFFDQAIERLQQGFPGTAQRIEGFNEEANQAFAQAAQGDVSALHGEEQTLARAFGSTTFGFKIREFDVEREAMRMNREFKNQLDDLRFQIRSKARDQSLTEAVRQRQINDLREQIDEIVRRYREQGR